MREDDDGDRDGRLVVTAVDPQPGARPKLCMAQALRRMLL